MPSHRQFASQKGNSQKDEQQKIANYKRRAVFNGKIGEAKDVSKPHRRADRRHYEGKVVSVAAKQLFENKVNYRIEDRHE